MNSNRFSRYDHRYCCLYWTIRYWLDLYLTLRSTWGWKSWCPCLRTLEKLLALWSWCWQDHGQRAAYLSQGNVLKKKKPDWWKEWHIPFVSQPSEQSSFAALCPLHCKRETRFLSGFSACPPLQHINQERKHRLPKSSSTVQLNPNLAVIN